MAKKRVTRKLSEKVKANIKANHSKLRKSDFADDALAYLNRVKGAAKGRKAKKQKIAKVDDLVIPKDSEIYRIVQKAAAYKKMSVAKYVKKFRAEIADLMDGGDFVFTRETEYLIEDIRHMKKGQSVFVNDGDGFTRTGAKTDIFNITTFTQHIFSNTEIFMIVYRVHRRLNGDLSHYLPSVNEYDELYESDDIESMLDGYYPEITYLKSAKRNERDVKQKIIAPHSRKRKKAKSKGKSVNGGQRKKTHKISKTK
jgi:hypothetical protein